MGKLPWLRNRLELTYLSCVVHFLDRPDRLMAASPLQLEIGLTGSVWTTGFLSISALRRMHGVVPETGGFHDLSHLAGNGKCQTSSVEEGMPPAQLQEFLWQGFFADQSQWWDNRRSKRTARHPDFKHKKSKIGLWLDNQHKPAWVDSRLANWDGRMKRPRETASTSLEGQRPFGSKVATYPTTCSIVS